MSTPESYQIPTETDPVSEEPINLTRSLSPEFRDWPKEYLDEIEFEFLKAAATARRTDDTSTVAYVEPILAKIDAERDRQERIVRIEAERRKRPVPTTRHDGPQLAVLAVQLKDHLSLIDFVEATAATMVTQRIGTRVKARCPNPLHPDTKPSCVIDERRFHCFGCGEDGDIFDLVGLVWGVTSFRDRISVVADYLRQAVSK